MLMLFPALKLSSLSGTDHVSNYPLNVASMHRILLFCLLLYTIATVLQLYHGGDMMDQMTSRKPKPTILPTQGIFNLPYHVGMV